MIGGLLAGTVRRGFDRVGALGSYTELDEMELEVSGLVTGEALLLRAAPSGSGALYWEFSGARGDWWTRLKVARDGVAGPVDFTGLEGDPELDDGGQG
jgi:hypothetical protein